jgi:hypothetical protein
LAPFLGKRRAAVLLGFGFVFAQSQGVGSHAPSLSLAKTPKSLAAAWLHYFLKRSKAKNEDIEKLAWRLYLRIGPI